MQEEEKRINREFEEFKKVNKDLEFLKE